MRRDHLMTSAGAGRMRRLLTNRHYPEGLPATRYIMIYLLQYRFLICYRCSKCRSGVAGPISAVGVLGAYQTSLDHDLARMQNFADVHRCLTMAGLVRVSMDSLQS